MCAVVKACLTQSKFSLAVAFQLSFLGVFFKRKIAVRQYAICKVTFIPFRTIKARVGRSCDLASLRGIRVAVTALTCYKQENSKVFWYKVGGRKNKLVRFIKAANPKRNREIGSGRQRVKTMANRISQGRQDKHSDKKSSQNHKWLGMKWTQQCHAGDKGTN